MTDPITYAVAGSIWVATISLVAVAAIVLKRHYGKRAAEAAKWARWTDLERKVASAPNKQFKKSCTYCVLCRHPHGRAPRLVFDKWPVCKTCVEAYDRKPMFGFGPVAMQLQQNVSPPFNADGSLTTLLGGLQRKEPS